MNEHIKCCFSEESPKKKERKLSYNKELSSKTSFNNLTATTATNCK